MDSGEDAREQAACWVQNAWIVLCTPRKADVVSSQRRSMLGRQVRKTGPPAERETAKGGTDHSKPDTTGKPSTYRKRDGAVHRGRGGNGEGELRRHAGTER